MSGRSLSRIAVLGLAVLMSATCPLRADEPPKFSAPEVNTFVRKFADLTDAYVKALKENDDHRLHELDRQAKDLEGDGAIQARLKPEEIGPFARFLSAQSDKIAHAGDTQVEKAGKDGAK